MKNSSRRTFLKYAGGAVIGGAWPGCATSGSGREGKKAGESRTATTNRTIDAEMNRKQDVTVQIQAADNPLVARTFSILKDRIEQRCASRVVESGAEAKIILTIDNSLPSEGFRIDATDAATRVAGGSPSGLLYGTGKFLRTSRYEGAFEPSPWRGVSQPRGSLRGMYFATHFHNWYQQASPAEVSRYMEDLALWGVNAVMAVFPMINLQDWNDPQAAPAMDMLRQYARTARDLGLQFATGVNNSMFKNAPKDIRATRLPDPTHRRGNSGNPVCPSIPEGHEYIMTNTGRLFDELSEVGLDILVHWPYDEGGCACAKCRPWGCNGYLKLSRDLTLLARKRFPHIKTVLSTWMFDTPPEGEWQGLADALAKKNDWVDYILADSHEDFPRYPLDVGVPGGLPLLNFPEISMWGNWPWGGFGANPLPSRLQRLWGQVKDVVRGGFPYSEGIYEDVNKVVEAQFYWDKDQSAHETMKEYIAYEFGLDKADDVLALIDDLEAAASQSYRKQPVDTDKVQRAYHLAESTNARLPDWAKQSWRWEILILRATLDRERFGGGSLDSPTAQAAMDRLMEIYHCQVVTDDPYHHRVRPPSRRAVSRNGEI